jgi:putative glutamine amidotransferase
MFNGLTRLILFVAVVCVGLSAAGEALPRIGITCVYKGSEETRKGQLSVSMAYVLAVREAGGLPVVVPPLAAKDEEARAQYTALLDGLVLVGGRDVPPSAYGEEPHATVKPLPEQRFAFESKLIHDWLATNKPLFGICLGAQMTNVALGGSLVQDIPSQVGKHVIHRGEGAGHTVALKPESRLAQIFGRQELRVNSSHHQAVKRLGRGLRVAATAPDGVIEAVEFQDKRFGLFVQWHPERMEDAIRLPLFRAFVKACRRDSREGRE